MAVLRHFLLGTIGFGSPIAVRDLVERRGWIANQDFLDGVALGQTTSTASTRASSRPSRSPPSAAS